MIKSLYVTVRFRMVHRVHFLHTNEVKHFVQQFWQKCLSYVR